MKPQESYTYTCEHEKVEDNNNIINEMSRHAMLHHMMYMTTCREIWQTVWILPDDT